MKATVDNRGKDFGQYRDMICKLAQRAWGRLQNAGVVVEFDDVFQDMCLIYCNVAEKYDPSKVAEGKGAATFITYLWRSIMNDYNKVAERLIREAVGEADTKETYNDHDARAAKVSGVPYVGKVKKRGQFNGIVRFDDIITDADLDPFDVIPSSSMNPEEELISSRRFSDGYRLLSADSKAVVKVLLKQAIPDRDSQGNPIDPDIEFINTSGVAVSEKRSEMKLNEIMLSMQFSRKRARKAVENISSAFNVDLKGGK